MKKLLVFFLLVISCSSEKPKKEMSYCNPMNLNYRFQYTNSPSYREAADPAMLRYKDKYILFASHSGGYWYSDDMLKWNLPAR